MIQRLVKEESGIAMAVAVMMVLLVGVMGAGLLTFVMSDTETVIESNQGQKALNLADAGVQAAKMHLMADADFRSYDGIADPASSPPNYESGWSCGAWNTGTATCGATGQALDLDPGSGNTVRVWIQYLLPSDTEAKTLDTTGVYAPDITPGSPPASNYPAGKDYFKVISQSTVGQTRRKIEAIYSTVSTGAPQAYYTPGNIVVSGTASINNISLFAGGNVTFNGGGSVTGTDLAYGKWADVPNDPASYPNPNNNTPRNLAAAGVGAAGTVNNKVAGRDYDVGTCPKFVRQLSDPSTCANPERITFPFNSDPNSPSLSDLAAAARAQSGGFGISNSNYYELPPTTSSINLRGSSATTFTGPKWPAQNGVGTIVYVKFTANPATPANNVLTISLDGDCATTPYRGTLVVENARVITTNTSSLKAPLKGTTIVRGIPSDPTKPAYKDTGGACMQSFVVASGDIELAGNVSPGTLERGNAAGTYYLKQSSWRELYR